MYDPGTGEITVPGFLDGLREPTAEELAMTETLFQQSGGREAESLPSVTGSAKVTRFVNDVTGAEVFQRYCFLPTMNINGLRAGFTGPGTTLWTLPHEAYCTIDHRLPPDLDPQQCLQRIREHLDAQGYADIQLQTLMSVGAQSLDLSHDLARAALNYFAQWQVEPMIWPRRGASGPTGYFSQMLGLQVLGSTGLGYASGHSSGNEFLVIEGNDQVGGLVELTCSYADLLFSYANEVST
jgi:acetylornithine deacetylase/succinyl-diaminopimelate desuccinylase-like protein